MAKRMTNSVVIIGIFLLANACEQQPGPADKTKHSAEPYFIPIVNPKIGDGNQQSAQEPSRQDPEAWKEASLVVFDLNRIVEKATDWKAAHAAVQHSLLEFEDQPFAYHIQQSIANRMLALHLLAENSTQEMKEAIAFYTELLLKNKHPDSYVLSKAIDRLEGFWTTERRRAAAAEALRFTDSYLQKNPCRACRENANIRMEDLSARERKLYEMNSSLPSLKTLAKSAR